MRLAAQVLTRAACLLHRNAMVHSWVTLDCRIQESRADEFGLDRLISFARADVLTPLYFEGGKAIFEKEGETGDGVHHLAAAFVIQAPRNRTPDVSNLIFAANRLREMAEYEEFLHATEPRTFHLVAETSPANSNQREEVAA